MLGVGWRRGGRWRPRDDSLMLTEGVALQQENSVIYSSRKSLVLLRLS